jgi:putative ABC transport system permease protein
VTISPSYFDVLRVTLVAGRAFTSLDLAGSEPVIIVGRDFAAKAWPGADPIGRRVRVGFDKDAPWRTVVGVAPPLSTIRTPDVKEIVYTPILQSPQLGFTLLASTPGDPLALTPGVRSALQQIDEDMALFNPNSVAAFYAAQGWHFRVFGGLFMSFGFAALLLASAGLYGVMAFSVRRRTGEIGVRMALGASRRRIIRMVLVQGMWRCLVGIVLGLAPAYWLGGAMRELLFNVTPADPLVISLTVLCLATAGFLASFIPALRAASVDPLAALRTE